MFLASFPQLLDFCSGLSQAFMVGRDSSVGITTRYRLDSQRIESQCGGEIVNSSPHQAWDPPSFQFNGYRVSFPGVDGFDGLVVSMLASGTQVCGFKPGRSRWIFTDVKILNMPTSGGEVKESVPCYSFAACKRT